ncbi:TPA: RNA 2'-phosphotransferase [Burkholderia vietnamiensis]|uniref:RNA 2'-phosphotransferase n=1 Tax=Burkholderia vietnamiensis TaxID=60552 RepID=UPI0015942ACA|nr:RNA 2'-phosphotransferase [Burkholderia vietnamiensis]HDR9010694.1 RNA 2'-phosphotransferase [Burkholderia vietnamiensis]HDR9016875.1 RNA 2'-phosphotransferase [Burkholderia vietnamiensis]
MNKRQLTDISKFLSFILRHAPESIGVQLDREGWASIDSVLAGATTQNFTLNREILHIVVSDNDKKRFEISADDQWIRAVQGHTSSSVRREYVENQPPEFLYHGTVERFLDSILKQGLHPGARHHVHLSANIETAISVGRRRGNPVVLKIDSARMYRHGFKFFLTENGVWLTAAVPIDFLKRLT